MSVIRLRLRAGSGSRAILPQVRLSPWDFETDVESWPCHHGQDGPGFPGFSGDAGSFRVRWCLPVTGQRTIGPSP